jgi:hypothetical protein
MSLENRFANIEKVMADLRERLNEANPANAELLRTALADLEKVMKRGAATLNALPPVTRH